VLYKLLSIFTMWNFQNTKSMHNVQSVYPFYTFTVWQNKWQTLKIAWQLRTVVCGIHGTTPRHMDSATLHCLSVNAVSSGQCGQRVVSLCSQTWGDLVSACLLCMELRRHVDGAWRSRTNNQEHTYIIHNTDTTNTSLWKLSTNHTINW